MTESPGYEYGYDAEGNTTSKTETATGNVTTYSYDHRNRLVGVTERDSGNDVIMQATYVYDALGRRSKTEVDADGAGGGSADVAWYAYDGWNSYADFNSGGTLTMRYLHGLAIDELYARMDSGGTVAWYLTDHLGAVRDIANTSGSVIDHMAYEAFGQIVSESSPGNGDRFKFTARECDAITGLQNNRNRYYDAAIGRWKQFDLIGFAAGDANLYRYVGNRPTNGTDPLGLQDKQDRRIVVEPFLPDEKTIAWPKEEAEKRLPEVQKLFTKLEKDAQQVLSNPGDRPKEEIDKIKEFLKAAKIMKLTVDGKTGYGNGQTVPAETLTTVEIDKFDPKKKEPISAEVTIHNLGLVQNPVQTSLVLLHESYHAIDPAYDDTKIPGDDPKNKASAFAVTVYKSIYR